MPDAMPEYLTLSEAAVRVGRSARSVRRWVHQGRLPNTKRLLGQILVCPSDLDAMLVADPYSQSNVRKAS